MGVIDRVEQPDDPDACWLWRGDTYDGYGKVYNQGRTRRAHRVSYEQNVGPIQPGYVIRHLCNNRLCIRPSHLAQGTQSENMLDVARARRANDATARAGDTAPDTAACKQLELSYTMAEQCRENRPRQLWPGEGFR